MELTRTRTVITGGYLIMDDTQDTGWPEGVKAPPPTKGISLSVILKIAKINIRPWGLQVGGSDRGKKIEIEHMDASKDIKTTL